jgi:hypothetical protein
MPTPSPELYPEIPPTRKRSPSGEDLTGHRFGKLVALRRLPNDHRQVAWLVLCDCGREKSCLSRYLRHGRTKSCGGKGCLVQSLPPARQKMPIEDVAARKIMSKYWHGAKKRNLEVSLTIEQVKLLTASRCHYCGQPPSNPMKARGLKVLYSGIDRVENGKGYVIENVVPCCYPCNLMKGSRSVEDFISHVKKILEHSSAQSNFGQRDTLRSTWNPPPLSPPPLRQPQPLQ